MDPINSNWWTQNSTAASTPASAGTQGQAPSQGTPPQAAVEPTGQQAQSTTTGQQPIQQQGESNQDFEQRLKAAEAERDAARSEVQQARAAISDFVQQAQQVQSQNQAQQVEADFARQRAEAIQQSENYAPQERAQFLDRELGRIDQQRNQFWQNQVQMANQAREQDRRTLGTPLFVDHLMKQNALPEAARERLMRMAAYSPDLAAQEAPALKAEYDRFGNIEQQINQLSRSNQAQNFRDQGAGIVGGQTPSGGAIQKTGNADQDAMNIYRAIQEGTISG